MRIRWMLVPLVASATIASAQTFSPRIGLFAGLNESQISGSSVSDISNYAAGALGAYVLAPIANEWSLQTGGVLSMKGWERTEPDTRNLDIAKLTYLEIPLTLRYDIAAANRVGAIVFAGPGFGFRTGCSISTTTHSTGQTATATCAEVDRLSNGTFTFKSLDVGAILGIGARVAVGREQLVLTAQYETGQTHIQNTGDATNRALTFGLGLEIPIHR